MFDMKELSSVIEFTQEMFFLGAQGETKQKVVSELPLKAMKYIS